MEEFFKLKYNCEEAYRGVYYVLGKINVLNLRFISVLKKWTSGQRTRKLLYISKIFPLKQQNT